MKVFDNRLDISNEERAIVESILKKNLNQQAKVFAFGSRVTFRTKASSDLDLALDLGRKISLEELTLLNYDFDESKLGFKVDIVDLNSIKEDFRKLIAEEMIRIL